MGDSILRIETGQNAQAFEEMTDSGDQTTFEGSFSPISNASGHEPIVAPYGVMTGGEITPNTGTNDSVSVAALTVMAPGMTGADSDGEVAVSSGNVAVTRPVTDTHKVSSITVNSSGSLVEVEGTEGTSFSETRGANGGPPLIPDGSIEVGQVRVSSQTSADITASEIFQVVGTHKESWDFPGHDVNWATGEITFHTALPAIHTGDIPKQVWIKGSVPIFAPIKYASEWVPAETTYSVNSTDTYDGPVGSSSSSLNQASFTFQSDDGLSDTIISLKGQDLWFKWQPDRDKSKPYQLTQGILGVSRSNPVKGKKPVSCTVTPREESTDITS